MSKAKPTMEEQLISFSAAKLAKEKGFNWKIDYCYPRFTKGLMVAGKIIIMGDRDANDTKNYVSAPTQSLLQKWLREKHSIHVALRFQPSQPTMSGFYYRGYIAHFSVFDDKLMILSKDISFTKPMQSYEEALEGGLKEALKLI